MAIVPDAVPEEALDYDEIFRRGGANRGDEDFALCKCPLCGRVYLVEYEVDTLYLDPANLARRIHINIPVSGFRCEECGGEFPKRTTWIGPKAPEAMQVVWQDLAASPWRWVAARTREGAADGRSPGRDSTVAGGRSGNNSRLCEPKMDPTAAFMVERIVAAGMAQPEEVIGCSEKEIRALEVIYKVRLPQAYRDFLAVMGHRAGRMFNPGEGWGFSFDCVKYLNWQVRFAHDLLSSGAPFPVPKTAFFIGTFQSIDYWFLDLADGMDDHPVWGYGDSWTADDKMPPRECRRVAASIWELVEAELEDRVACRYQLARMERELFDGEPGAEEARAVDELRLRGLRDQWEACQRRCEARRAESNYDDEMPF